MLIRVELCALLTETKEENGERLLTWQQLGRRGLYQHREIVGKLLKSYGYNLEKHPDGIKVKRK